MSKKDEKKYQKISFIDASKSWQENTWTRKCVAHEDIRYCLLSN